MATSSPALKLLGSLNRPTPDPQTPPPPHTHTQYIPRPWQADILPSGALYGDLPLIVPRPREDSLKIVVSSRSNDVTTYEVHKGGQGAPIRFKIETCNELLLLDRLNLFVIGARTMA